MTFSQITCVQELQPFDKFDSFYVIHYKQKRKAFPKQRYVVILKDAELYIFEKTNQPPLYMFPLDHCQVVAAQENLVKLEGEVTSAKQLFKLTVKDGAEFLLLPETFEKQAAWVQTLLSYSDNYKIYLKHKINHNAPNAPTVRIQVIQKGPLVKHIAKSILQHVARVTHVEIDEEGVADVFGDFVSPIAIMDALECAGFNCQLLSLMAVKSQGY